MVLIRYAKWNRPEGGESTVNHRLKLPVTHVSYDDARAFCTWKNMRLPTEIEWEYAARGGLDEKDFPWGNGWKYDVANIWHGDLQNPREVLKGDRYLGPSPVDAMERQNNYELHDMIGNVWEWTLSK
jgi:formylglycine-generating enzyme